MAARGPAKSNVHGEQADIGEGPQDQHYAIITYDDSTHWIRLEAHDYMMNYMNQDDEVGRIKVYDGNRLVDSFDVEVEGVRRLYNDAERTLRFETQGRAYFALTHPKLGDEYGLPSGVLARTVDGDFAATLFRGGRPFFVCLEAENRLDAEIYSGEFRLLLQEKTTFSIGAYFDENLTWQNLALFVHSSTPTAVNITISLADCSPNADSPDGFRLFDVSGPSAPIIAVLLAFVVVAAKIRRKKG